MSDAPYFPPPGTASAPPQQTPYREPATRASSAPVVAREPSPPREDKAALYTALASELEAGRRRQRRHALALVVGGLALVAVAVALSVASSGAMIFHGLVGLGVLLVTRGFERVLRSFFR